MKISINIPDEINTSPVSVQGTGFMGQFQEEISYDQLVKVFGKPNRIENGNGKIKCQWAGTVCGLVFTIYDYKSQVEPENNRDWHIGGRHVIVAEILREYLKKKTA